MVRDLRPVLLNRPRIARVRRNAVPSSLMPIGGAAINGGMLAALPNWA